MPRISAVVEQVHAELAGVASERDAVAAALRCVEGLAPALARMFTPSLAADGTSVGLDLAWEWTPDRGLQRPPPELRPGPIHLPPLAPDWSAQPRQGLVIADAAQVAGCAESLLRGVAGELPRGVALLPLFAGGGGHCQGLLALAWAGVRTFTDDEQALLSLVRHALAAALALQAAERTARIALQEISQFYALGDALNAAPTLHAALEAAALPMVGRGATAAALSSVERADDGTITAVRTVAAVDLEGATDQPGHALGEDPLADLWISGSSEPLLIDDVEADPRVDPGMRAHLRAAGQRAAAILPLASHGRTLGALYGFWPDVQAFGERDQRFLARLAAASATTFENRVLVERMAAAMHDSARKAAIVEAVLEHLPVGVWVVDAPSGQTRLANQLAVAWLGAGDDATDAGRGRYLTPGGALPLASGQFTLERTLRDGQLHEGELDILGADGERRSYITVSAPIAGVDGEVWGALTCVRDVSAERRSERERHAAQEALMAAERSTPLIPITRDIRVIPLIGSLDGDRGQRLMEVALAGVRRDGVRVCIIDVTGARSLDTRAAASLHATARALRLLGAQVVLTGIGVEAAQTLSGLGIALSEVIVRGTLESGIAEAFLRTGRTPPR